MELTPEYVAGFFDGEGCIHLSTDHTFSIQIAQINREVLESVQRLYGGQISQSVVRTREHPRWTWGVYGLEEIQTFLEAMYPRTIVKQAQCWLALEFLAQRTKYNGRRMPDSERALREGFRLAIKEAKRV